MTTPDVGATLSSAPSDSPDARSPMLDRLLAAAAQLATTIQETERIASRTAWIANDPRALHAGHPDGSRDRLLTLNEVARLTGRHPDLLRRWCLEGRLAGVRVGRTWCLPERMVGQLGRFQRRRSSGAGDLEVGGQAAPRS